MKKVNIEPLSKLVDYQSKITLSFLEICLHCTNFLCSHLIGRLYKGGLQKFKMAQLHLVTWDETWLFLYFHLQFFLSHRRSMWFFETRENVGGIWPKCNDILWHDFKIFWYCHVASNGFIQFYTMNRYICGYWVIGTHTYWLCSFSDSIAWPGNQSHMRSWRSLAYPLRQKEDTCHAFRWCYFTIWSISHLDKMFYL